MNNGKVAISIDSIDVGELLRAGNPSCPIIAGNLPPHIHCTKIMSSALGNNPRLQHTEKEKLGVELKLALGCLAQPGMHVWSLIPP